MNLIKESPTTCLDEPLPSFDHEIIFSKKSAYIYQILKRVHNRFSQSFGKELFREFHRFFALSLPAFHLLRSEKHLARIILTQFRARTDVKNSLILFPEKRHLHLRLLSTTLNNTFGKKSVLGIVLTISLFDSFERIDEEHLLSAIRKWIPNTRLVHGSRYTYQHLEEERVFTLYVEIDKEHGFFSSEEKACLKKILSQELKDRVQRLLPTVYNPRNEENLMKNMIILSQEFRDPNTLPQVMISFENQTQSSLFFTLIIVYSSQHNINEESLLQLNDPYIQIYFERKTEMGYCDCRTPKEALVLRAKVSKITELQRKDFSVNAYYARQKVLAAICEIIGEVRDYDGGLIQKQHELFTQLHKSFANDTQKYSDFLERLFFSIRPIEKQALLSIADFEIFFTMIDASLTHDFSEKGAHFFRFYETEKYLYALFATEGSSFKQHLYNQLNTKPFLNPILTTSFFSHQETSYFLCILERSDPLLGTDLKNILFTALLEWRKEQEQFNTLHLNFSDLPLSLDPRKAGDEEQKVILNFLFDGLMRFSAEGKLEYALAESVDISPDRKVYTFKLRPSLWSNQTPLEAHDFVYAWSKILSPTFETPFDHIFYCIKNAQLAKKGVVGVEEVGIRALDPYTLEIELLYPVSYFLELLAQPLFAPVNRQVDISSPQWPTTDGGAFVCNGPFYLKKNQGDHGYILEKNPYYWDVKNISLSRVTFTITSASSALEMFKHNKLDWIGRPMRIWEPQFTSAHNADSEIMFLRERVSHCMFNTRFFPFSSQKLRRALALVINRTQLIEQMGFGAPAYSLLHSYQTFFPICDKDEREKGALLFEEALHELGLSRVAFPRLILDYPQSERWAKMARILKEQWESCLGIRVTLVPYTFSTLFYKAMQGDCMANLTNWYSWVDDPMYTLGTFKFAENSANFPHWENSDFQNLLNKATEETNPENRALYLKKAEEILIQENPVIPLLYEKEVALKKKQLNVPTKRGHVDFKNSKILKKEIL